MKKLALVAGVIGVVFAVLSLWVAVPLAVGVIIIGSALVVSQAHE